MSGKEVRAIREARRETQLQLALVIGVTEHSVWRWEAGMHPPSPPAAHLLRALDPRRKSALAIPA
jgi:DNA-binding transcriptional regulator YiaG